MTRRLTLSLLLGLLASLTAQDEERRKPALVSSLDVADLVEFDHLSPALQQLLREAAVLTRLQLTYVFASSDPKRGGMDCSGTMYHLLKQAGHHDTPRQSDEMASWVQTRGQLHLTPTADTLKHAEFAALKPGDLVFWSGTYETTQRKIPVTHVMLYLGHQRSTGKPVVFGSSDGRSYEGQKRTGVSLFDFVVPKASSKTKLYGYGHIPPIPELKAPSPKASPTAPKRRNRR